MNEDKRDFDKDAAFWDENPLRRGLGEAIGKAIASTLRLERSDIVLDYGAGTGLVSLALSPRVAHVIAADSSRGMLDVLGAKLAASRITNLEPLFLDLEDPAAVPPEVDVIVSSMTLHHVRDIPQLAGRFFTMLRSGGRIALADLATEAGDFHADNTGVRHFGFAADWLTATFARAGFAGARAPVAHTVSKPVASGEHKQFPILLLTATKP